MGGYNASQRHHPYPGKGKKFQKLRNGGGARNRTGNLLVTKELLFQLSYTAWCWSRGLNPGLPPYQGGTLPLSYASMVDVPGLEPGTFCVSSRCSSN